MIRGRGIRTLIAGVGLALFLGLMPASAPASGGAVQVSVAGSGIDVKGTKQADHIRIGRRPDEGNYVIEADRTIKGAFSRVRGDQGR